MKFYVVPISTRLAEEFADLNINPVVMGYFPEQAMKAMGWDKSTILIMTVEKDGFYIREENPEMKEGELQYVPLDEL